MAWAKVASTAPTWGEVSNELLFSTLSEESMSDLFYDGMRSIEHYFTDGMYPADPVITPLTWAEMQTATAVWTEK
jgi:hypothetical protein